MLDKQLLKELKEYVEKHNVFVSYRRTHSDKLKEEPICLYSESLYLQRDEIKDFVKNNRKQTFNQILFDFIDRKGVADSDIYKKAGIDRRHFSKIRSKKDYKIRKNTVIVLALALELKKSETEELLNAAGYSLSGNDTFDLIIQFFLERKIYDLHALNQALDYFSLKPLSAALE